MSTSETVQAAQRMLAELTTAAQPAFITSESCGPTAEYRHVFKFRTLAELQAFGRAWDAAALLTAQGDSVTDFNLYTSPDVWTGQPAPAAAPEDAERAAHLARWKDAPEWAQWLSQDSDGRCYFWEFKPTLVDDAEWSMSGQEASPSERVSGCFSVSGHDNRPRPRPRPKISELKPPTATAEKINIHGFDFAPQNFNVACETCGRKRCPHAHDNRMQCTGVPIKDPVPAPEDANDAERRFGPITSDPADAERNIRAKEDAERAAYLERWKCAPVNATHLAEGFDGRCWRHSREPFLRIDYAGANLLGSVRCEPRPVQGVEG